MEPFEKQKLSTWYGRLIVVAIVVACAFPIANIGADAASGKCPKAGKQQTVRNVKYMCVKSGRALIWRVQKPSTTTVAATTTTATATTTTTVVDLSVDSSISTAEKLSALNDCKIPAIAGGTFSSGFPRSASLPGR